MTQTTHWAAELIGKPYLAGACGPDTFDCWGLVRHVFKTVHGIEMPVVVVGDSSVNNVRSIKQAAEVSGWRPTDEASPADGDIVLMMGFEGPHVGVMVEADGRLIFLHCIERVGVCAQPISDLSRAGFRNFVFWRRT